MYGKMRFWLNGGRTSTVNIEHGLGGDAVVLPKSPREYKGGPTVVQRQSNGSPTDALRSTSQAPGLPHALCAVVPRQTFRHSRLRRNPALRRERFAGYCERRECRRRKLAVVPNPTAMVALFPQNRIWKP